MLAEDLANLRTNAVQYFKKEEQIEEFNEC